jgi:hypothetical protein
MQIPNVTVLIYRDHCLKVASFMCTCVYLWWFAEVGVHEFPMSISLHSGHIEQIVERCRISEVAQR